MQADTAIVGLAETIQVSIAPVLLLTCVGGFLAVLTNRLARVIDRTRALQERPPRQKRAPGNCGCCGSAAA